MIFSRKLWCLPESTDIILQSSTLLSSSPAIRFVDDGQTDTELPVEKALLLTSGDNIRQGWNWIVSKWSNRYKVGPMAISNSQMRGMISPKHFAVYFVTGIATVLIGPALPLLSRSWHISDDQGGALFALQFGGAITGSILSTYRPKTSYPLGCGCCAVALAAIGWTPWMLAHWLFFLDGMGLGMIINAGNNFVTQFTAASGGSEAGALAKVHFAWGVGAVSCPWILQTVTRAFGPSVFFATIGVAFGIFAWVLALSRPTAAAKPDKPRYAQPTCLSLGLQIAFAVAFLLYTGTENAISGWLPSFAIRAYGERVFSTSNGLVPSSSVGAISFTLLWGAHLLGRACTPLAVSIFKEPRLFSATIHSLVVSVLLLTFIPGRFNDQGVAVCVTAAACGLSLAAVYPLMMANMLRQAGGLRGMGWILACGPVGGALLPWLSGVASTRLGGIRSALYVPCIAVVLLLFSPPKLYPRQPAAKLSQFAGPWEA